MKKNLIIGVGVTVAVLVIGGVAFAALGKDNETDSNKTASSSSETSQSNAAETPKTIDGFLSAGKNQKCTLSTNADDVKITGTMYFSADKKMRADYASESDGKTTTGQMIITEDAQYIWASSSKQGIKLDLSEAVADSKTNGSGSAQGLDTKQEYDFSCQSWTVDKSKFVPPSDVTFTDFAEIKSQLPR